MRSPRPFASTHRILDLGCNVAALGRIIYATGYDGTYTGVDSNPYAVSEAQQELQALGHVCEIRIGNIRDLPFSDRSFPCVVMKDVLEHMEGFEGLLTEACRVADETLVVANFIPWRWRAARLFGGNRTASTTTCTVGPTSMRALAHTGSASTESSLRWKGTPARTRSLCFVGTGLARDARRELRRALASEPHTYAQRRSAVVRLRLYPRSLLLVIEIVADLADQLTGVAVGDDLSADIEELAKVLVAIRDEQSSHPRRQSLMLFAYSRETSPCRFRAILASPSSRSMSFPHATPRYLRRTALPLGQVSAP